MNEYFLRIDLFSLEKCEKAATKRYRNGLKTLLKIATGLKKPVE